MKHWVFIVLSIGLAASCGNDAPPPAQSPSPLLSADHDRLWILARASRVGDGRKCKDLYLNPDDPRHQKLRQQCDSWARDYADYLRINGFPTIEYQHLKEPVYWQWYLDKRQQITDCLASVGNLSLTARGSERAEHARRRNECDAYDDARNNQKLTPADLGIRFK